jgi:exocyst complex component 8
LLEARGLSLSSVLMKQFRPSVEQALDSNLRRIEESTAALAAADDWILTYPPTGIRPLARSYGNLALQPKNLECLLDHNSNLVQRGDITVS